MPATQLENSTPDVLSRSGDVRRGKDHLACKDVVSHSGDARCGKDHLACRSTGTVGKWISMIIYQ